MTTAAWQIQTAIYGRLIGDEDLMGLVSGVYDEPPAPAAHPYVTIGDVTEVPDDAHDRQGVEATATLHIWSKYRGYHEAAVILRNVDRLLDRQPLPLDGFQKVSVANESHQFMRDPDPDVRHVTVQFRIWAEEVPPPIEEE